MNGQRGLSLRFRIAGGVLAGLVVLFSVFGFLAVRTIDLSVDVALDERLRLAQISAESVDELLEHTALQLERAAVFVAAGPPDEERTRVADAYDLLGEFDRIVRLGLDGSVLWMVPSQPATAGWPAGQTAAVQVALEGGQTTVLAPARGDPADDLIAIIITPLERGDRSTGFLAGELRASHADVDLLMLPASEGSVRAEIVDASGYVVAQPHDGDSDPPDAHVGILGPIIARGEPGTTIHEIEDGPDHVIAYYPFRAHPGGVVVEQTEDAAFVIPQEMQRTLLAYGILALVISSVAAWLHAHTVVRPIRRLSGDAARMASGDLDSPIVVARDDEIGELGRRFDEMRVKLKASLEESARWADELEHRVDERTREVEEKNRELNVLNRIRRQLLAKTISAQEEERKRLARELHDDSAQTLTAVLMTLKTAEDALPAGPHDARSAMDRSRSQLELALREIRKAIVDLRPSALDDLGLAAAARTYATEHLRPYGIEVAFSTSGEEQQATGAAATAVFRIVQEAVSNAARHSGARKVRIVLDFGPTAVVTEVRDDGTGFDPAGFHQPQESGRGLGLLGMRERAELFGGDVDIESGPGKGTTVRVRIPYA
ncbi:MAG TPA: ATP-binding protein [Candidatus Limnocylindrales bacterium]|nr:ATP-binding protein [Candidatus Limnocylindrales bacterium]